MIPRFVKRTFSSSWGWRLAGPFVRSPGVIVLEYHRILGRTLGRTRAVAGTAVEHFTAQMRWLKANCEPIHPDELLARAQGARRVTRPAALVTFDDGYRDYHDLAYPVLKDLGIPAVVFVTTGLLDAGVPPWTDELRWAVLHSTRERVRLPWTNTPPIRLNGTDSRAALGETACSHLKRLDDGDRRLTLAALLSDLGDVPLRERQMLTWDEVRRTMDITTYGGHSHLHPILSRLTPAQCEHEIRTCRDRLVTETGIAPKYFAYPNGQPEDFTMGTEELLRRHGFEMSFASTQGVADARTNWMAVKRVQSVDAGAPEFAWFAARLSRK